MIEITIDSSGPNILGYMLKISDQQNGTNLKTQAVQNR